MNRRVVGRIQPYLSKAEEVHNRKLHNRSAGLPDTGKSRLVVSQDTVIRDNLRVGIADSHPDIQLVANTVHNVYYFNVYYNVL